LRPQLIKAKLVERGISQRSIARELGVTPAAIYQVISGKSRSTRIEKAIAKAAQVPQHTFARRAA
jgi:predicted transcriptional regulator